jgi:nicotinamidase/pyrazinamidase
MGKTVFWDVDTQQDFMYPDGKLYVPGAEDIIPNLARLRRFASTHGVRTIASADDHVPSDPEISDHPDSQKTFPPHCMRGTTGQQRIPETALRDPLIVEPTPRDREQLAKAVLAHRGDILFHKHTFDVFSNGNVLPVLDAIDPEEIVLFGVALDICDRYAIEGLLRHRPDTRLQVVTDATAAIDAERGDALLQSWRARGVVMTTTRDVVSARASTMSSSR